MSDAQLKDARRLLVKHNKHPSITLVFREKIQGGAEGFNPSLISGLNPVLCATFPVPLWMETGTASSSSSLFPSSLWRLAERRNRKAGSGNIFSSVNLWQLQRLFRAAGDEDAEQRAELIWGHRDEAELAQALIGLRARSHRKGLRSNGREALGSHWLRAFHHLRIGENLSSSQREDPDEESDCKSEEQRSPETCRHSSVGASARETGAKLVLNEIQSPVGPFERTNKTNSGLRRGESNPERYLHRILH